MSIIGKIRGLVLDPRIRDVDVNSSERIAAHREILFSKKLMIEVFREFYKTCRDLDEKYFRGEGLRVEIGSGSSVFKHYYPDIVTTDIESSPHIDRILDAQRMDLLDSTVRSIYGINCFHHFPEPERFFRELDRVLIPGGGCILIEPYHGPFSAFIHGAIHSQEHFNKNQEDWDDKQGSMKVMSGANQALSYVVFVRDRELLNRKFPSLEIAEMLPLKNYLRYLLSGGLNFRQLVPDFFTPAIRLLETVLAPFAQKLALHYIIVLRKVEDAGLS